MPAPSAAGPVWLVTGASRGIGLQLVTELLAGTASAGTVVAAARKPSDTDGLQALKVQHGDRLQLVPLDAADAASIQAAAQWVQQHVGRLDVLVNNAGVSEHSLSGRKPWHVTDADEAACVLATNVTGPVLVTAAFLPLLKSSPGPNKRVAHISSGMGSVARTAEDGRKLIDPWVAYYAAGGKGEEGTPPRAEGYALSSVIYRASKAALNMEMLIMARDLAADNITVVALHPGWVDTDMGGASRTGMKPPVTPEQSAQGMLRVLEGVGLKDTGSFLTWEGNTLPW